MERGLAEKRRKRRSWTRPRPEGWADRPLNLATMERGTLVLRAADLIRGRILAGDVAPGRRLEPMRRLAAELGVSLPSVREAIAQLRGEGLVEVRHGVGCFVTRRPHVARSLRAAVRRSTRREMGEMRVVVDPAVASAAARHATRGRAANLLSAQWELEAARRSGSPEAYVDADLEFHVCVARAAGGQVAVATQRLAAAVLRPVLRARASGLADDGELANLHRTLADAIEGGRPHRAARAARAIALRETVPK